jgi:ribosomal protein L18E
MSATKLTLSTDKDTIELAKSLASESNTSVSKLFKTLVTELAKKRRKKDPILEKYKNVEIPQWIKDLTIEGTYDSSMSDDEIKYEYLKEKYGL